MLLFVVINIALLARSGVRIGGDTGIYIDGARSLLAGAPLSQRQPSYVGYIAVVALFESIGAGLIGVALFQIAVATVAAGAVFRLGAELGGPVAGAVAAVLLAIDIDTNRWHAFILTDSLYFSALVMAAWLVHRATNGRSGLMGYVVASLALLVAALIRPEGWFVFPVAAVYWVFRGVSSWITRGSALVAVVLACGLMVVVVGPRLSGNVEAVDPAEMLRRGQTIWSYDGWRVPMPQDPGLESGAASGPAAVSYALRHPLSTAVLMAARVGVHIAHVRPYFSWGHNAAIVMWLLPLYLAGAYGAWAMRGDALVVWSLAVIGSQALVVALTHADWDGRYLAHVLPVFYPLAGCGVARISERWWPRGERMAVAG